MGRGMFVGASLVPTAGGHRGLPYEWGGVPGVNHCKGRPRTAQSAAVSRSISFDLIRSTFSGCAFQQSGTSSVYMHRSASSSE